MAEESKQDPARSLSNRIFLRISGKRFRAYSFVGHVGRTTGWQYRNAVSAYPLGDGFVIAVLYGIESNWVRNVMAAGRFTLQTKGRDYLLERPEIIAPAQAIPAYPALYCRMMRTRNIQHFVWRTGHQRSTGSLMRGCRDGRRRCASPAAAPSAPPGTIREPTAPDVDPARLAIWGFSP
jgi:hypothetical protein